MGVAFEVDRVDRRISDRFDAARRAAGYGKGRAASELDLTMQKTSGSGFSAAKLDRRMKGHAPWTEDEVEAMVILINEWAVVAEPLTVGRLVAEPPVEFRFAVSKP
jgi:hypothetical protein